MAFLRTYGMLCCAIMMILLLGALHFYALPKMSYKAELNLSGTESPILLPNLESSGTTTVIHINYQLLQQTQFQVYSRGCIKSITIDDSIVPFTDRQRCSFAVGMRIDLAPFLSQGKHLLTIERDRPGKLQIGPLLFNHDNWLLADWLSVCLIGVACIFLILFFYRYTQEILSGYLLAAGLLIYIYQFSQASFMQYTMDMPGHLEYINFIANYWHWPVPYAGHEYYQPPLYYSIQALILLFVNWLGSFDTVSALRVFSLGCFMTFLVFATLILHRLIRNRLAYYSALLLLVFYPSGILFAARIDSNLLFYSFCAGCLYFMLRWLEEKKDRHIGLGLTFLGLGLATRSNMLILLPLIGLADMYHWQRRVRPIVILQSRAILLGLIVLFLGMSANFGREIYYHTQNTDVPFLVANSNKIDTKFSITNSWDRFLLLDLQTYIARPFWNILTDKDGRQYFWNSLLKSSLFGEFDWNQGMIAKILSILLLGLIIYIGSSLIFCWQDFKRQREWWFFMAVLFVPIAALITFRLLYPFACSQDFRYIYPALIGFCGMFGLTIERQLTRHQYMLAGGGIMLVIVFSTCSALFFLAQ